MVPADKAVNNVIVVCKKYYLEMVLDELNATQTYFKDSANIAHIISKHVKYMNKNSIKVEPNMEDMPSFYWLPKLHKNPYGKRFVAASHKCTTKALSKLLTTCFTTITIYSF